MTAFSVAAARSQLASTPAVVAELLGPLPDALWRVDEGPGTWTPFEIVCHLLHGEDDDWIPRLRMTLEGGGTFTTFQREAGMAKYGDLMPDELLDRFAAARRASLATFDGWAIDQRALSLRAVHPELGPVTLEQLLACWVTHDLAHVAQLARVLVRHHGAFVGPWKAFFSLLRDV